MCGTLGLKYPLYNDLRRLRMITILSAPWPKSDQREQTSTGSGFFQRLVSNLARCGAKARLCK